MIFFKSLLLAILATVFLTYAFGTSLMELLNINISMDGKLIEPIKAIGVSAMATVILMLIGLTIVFSVFGSMIFVSLLIVSGLVLLAVGVFWPILLFAGIIWLLVKDKENLKSNPNYS